MMRFLLCLLSFFTALLFIVVMFNGCAPLDDHEDGGTPDDCAAACANLEQLGCDGAEGSPGVDEEYGTEDDVPCEDVCRDVMEGGITMHPACVAAAESCEAVDECFS